jgi:hypothetical protein
MKSIFTFFMLLILSSQAFAVNWECEIVWGNGGIGVYNFEVASYSEVAQEISEFEASHGTSTIHYVSCKTK